MTVGLLVMAYGTASGPGDIERYYTDIRGGRAPDPHHLEDLKRRYAAIGNRFPLLDITRAQADGLERELNSSDPEGFRAYLGMKHSPPFIEEAVARMRDDRIGRAVGIVMAPHWSGMSVETYVERVDKAVAGGGGPAFTFVRHWYQHPLFVELLAGRVRDALDRLDPGVRDRAGLVFSAHSLPTRTTRTGQTLCLRCFECQVVCRYAAQLADTGSLLCERLGRTGFEVAWQSAGRTSDPWWGPPVEDVIRDLAARGHTAVVVCSAGFVADHLEILYDLDIEARAVAEEAGVAFVRTEMPNADPEFVRALGAVIREHMAEEGDG